MLARLLAPHLPPCACAYQASTSTSSKSVRPPKKRERTLLYYGTQTGDVEGLLDAWEAGLSSAAMIYMLLLQEQIPVESLLSPEQLDKWTSLGERAEADTHINRRPACAAALEIGELDETIHLITVTSEQGQVRQGELLAQVP